MLNRLREALRRALSDLLTLPGSPTGGLDTELEAVLDQLEEAIERLLGRLDQLEQTVEDKHRLLGSRLDKLEQSMAAKPASKARTPKAVAPAAPPPAERGCLVPGCDGEHQAKGLCGKHYQRYRRKQELEPGISYDSLVD
jgi:TolA-binding protein